ncbi:MAG: GatB/YqeY domain-containing protein [Candidatus Saccharimonadales bacterium]
MLEQRLEDDIKKALLAGDSARATTLRTLKSTLLNVKVAEGKRDSGLSDQEVITIFSKEAKKRQESADMYVQGNAQDKADKELAEKAIIEEYLPEQLSEDEIAGIVDEVIEETGAESQRDMGKVIAGVRAKTAGSADGSIIARLTKERLTQ